MNTSMKTVLLSLLTLATGAVALAGNWTNFSNTTQATCIAVVNNQVWVAAKGGLMMYDKNSGAKTFYKKSPAELPSLTIERVTAHPITNDIWIGTYDNGLAFLHNNTWTHIPFPIQGTMLYEMKISPSGTVWCATSEGLYRYQNNQFTAYATSAGNPWDIDLFPNGKILCGHNQVYIYDPATNQTVVPNSTAFAYGSSHVYVKDDHTYYFSGDHGELAEFNDTTEVDTIHIALMMRDMNQHNGSLYMLRDDQLFFAKNAGEWNKVAFGDSNLAAFTIDASGDLWGGSAQDGNTLFHNNTAIDVRRSDIATNWVNYITKAEDGNVLLVGPDVIQKYNLSTNAFTETIPTNFSSIGEAMQLNSKTYVGSSYHYLNVYDAQNGWQQLGAGTLPSAEVDHLDADAQGNVWLCGPGYVARYNGSNFTIYNSSNNANLTSNLYLRDIHCDHTRNAVWVASYSGIFKIDANGVSFYNDSTPGIQQYYDAVETINEDAAHNIWFGTIYGGIVKFDGNVFTTRLLPITAGNQFISGIEFIGNTMYVTDNLHGVWVYENNQWDSLNMGNCPISSNYVICSYADANGNLWLGNPQYGVDVYNKNGTTVNITGPEVSSVSVFPNPANGRFNVQLNEAAEVNIYAVNGALVQQLHLNAGVGVINLTGYTPGIYVAQIKGNSSLGIARLMLQ